MLNDSARYDVIFIGAGLEGLLCAALLSKRGKRVLVLEETQTAGGTSTQISKSGYTFVKGPTLFLGFERDGLYDRLFTELGLSLAILKREGAIFQKENPPLQIVLPNHRLDYFTDPEELQDELKREFPDQIQELTGLWQEIGRGEELIRPRMQQALRIKPLALRDRLNALEDRFRYYSAVRKLKKQDLLEMLRARALDPEIQRGLELLFLLFTGKTLQEADGLDLVHLLGLVQREMITVSGGNPRLSALCVKVIQENLGEVVYGQAAADLMLRHRSVEGVRTADGMEIRGTSVVLNLPWTPDGTGPWDRREGFSLYFGLTEKVIPPPMKNHVLFLTSYERAPVADNFLYLRMNSTQDRWAAPEGARALQVYGLLPDSDRPRKEVLEALIPLVGRHLAWLIPFSEGELTFLGDDSDHPPGERRVPSSLGESVRISRTVARDGGRFHLTSLKSLFILPDLGRRPASALESARSALELADQLSRVR